LSSIERGLAVAHTHKLSRRYWIEVTSAVLGTVLFTLTLAFPEWIEALFRVDPDGGNGFLEIGIAVAFLAVAMISSLLARREWLRAAPA
jgi:hypothetical protein